MFHDPTFWVAVAFVIFIALVSKPIGKLATKALDERADKIRADMDEAERLREEAQDLLASYQRKQRDAANEADEIVRHAKAEAERISREGRERLQASLERREKMATDRIALAEHQAVERVRAHAIDIAVEATRGVLAAGLAETKANALVDAAITELPVKLH